MRNYIFTLSALLLLLTGCGDDISEVMGNPETPKAYRQLVQARDEGKTYLTTKMISSAAKVFFADGTSVIAKKSEMEIFDLGGDEPATLSYDNGTGMWLINGVSSGILRENVPDSEAYPVYS